MEGVTVSVASTMSYPNQSIEVIGTDGAVLADGSHRDIMLELLRRSTF
jgi:hypothetical protein